MLNEFNGTPYKWGKSTITESDCSGTICATINAVFNKNIRVTANDLFYNIFTEPYTKGTENIHAVFFINKDKKAVKTGFSESDQIMERALMTPDELRRMPQDDCIIFEKGIKPIITDTIPLTSREDIDLSKFKVLSVAPLFAEMMEKVYNNKAISDSFVF